MCARFLTEKKEGSLRGKYGDISIKGSSNRAILPEPKSYYLHACSELLYVWVGWCSGRDSNPGLRLERPEYLVHAYACLT